MRFLGVCTVLVAGLVVAAAGAWAAPFSDLPQSHWAYSAVQRAVDAGILEGYDGKFNGGQTLNRFQMAVIICKMMDALRDKGGAVSPEMGQDLNALVKEFGDELALMDRRLATVEEKVEKLETAQKTGTAEPSTMKSRLGKSVKVGGIVKTWWDNPRSSKKDEFDLRNARLLVTGQLSQDVKFMLQSDGAHDNSKAEGGADNPSIIDLKLSFNLDRANPWTTWLQVGRFIPNFTRYMPVLIDTMDFIRYPLFLEGSRLAIFRQSGMEIYHVAKDLKFTLGILNGSSVNDNFWNGDVGYVGTGTDDSNDAKDYFLRVDVAPKGSEWSGAVYHWDGQVGANEYDRTRTGAFVEWKGKELRALGEYIVATDESSSGKDVDKDAYYVQAIYRPTKSRLEYLARYDEYDPNDDVSNDGEDWFTLGLNYFIVDKECFFSLNQIDKNYDCPTSADDKEWIGQFTFIF